MNSLSVHKQLLLATAAVQRKALAEEVRSLRLAAQGLAESTQRHARSASVWAAVAAALWSVRPRRGRKPAEAATGAARESGGVWSWARTALSLALALRPWLDLRSREETRAKS